MHWLEVTSLDNCLLIGGEGRGMWRVGYVEGGACEGRGRGMWREGHVKGEACGGRGMWREGHAEGGACMGLHSPDILCVGQNNF